MFILPAIDTSTASRYPIRNPSQAFTLSGEAVIDKEAAISGYIDAPTVPQNKIVPMQIETTPVVKYPATLNSNSINNIF